MKKALIVANLAGFASFLISDMEILIGMGYDVTFAANGNKLQWDDTKQKLDKLNVRFIQVDFDSKNPFTLQNVKAYGAIKELLKNENFSLIHCHTPIPGVIVRFAAAKYRKKGAKVIYTTHGFTFTSHSSKKSWLLYYTLEKLCSSLCDAIITINKEDCNNAKTMNCKHVFYINGVGVNIEKYKNVDIDRNLYRKQIGVPQDKIMVLSVGELSGRKNHQIVIKALSQLSDKDKYCYVICGNGINGGTGNELKILANKLGVSLNLLGFRRDIPEIMHCSDIGALPSVREGLGLSGIQSLAAGIPLAGSDVQGIRDYIVDGKTGFLCDSSDSISFAHAIERLSNKELVSAMKNNCISMAEQFDISVSEKQRADIYKTIIG